MIEKLPQRIQGENRLETTEKRPSMEGPPVVEHMLIGGADVLVKITFPRSESVAKIFMLIRQPVSEQGTKNIEKILRESQDEEDKKIIKRTYESMNSPLIFRDREDAQAWFDMVYHGYGYSERKAIADFLEIEDNED